MDNFNIKGEYKFKQGEHIIYEGENIITLLGVSFFLNRCINDNLNPIKSIVLGNGETTPLISDESLGNELVRRTCIREANLNGKNIKLTSSFNANEVIGVTEIGVATDNILVSHDVFEEITSTMLSNPIGTVEVEYTFQFSTGTIREGWNTLKQDGIVTNAFYLYEPSVVMGVEDKFNNGFRKVNTKNEVITTEGTYYYDGQLDNVYVHCYDNLTPNEAELLLYLK